MKIVKQISDSSHVIGWWLNSWSCREILWCTGLKISVAGRRSKQPSLSSRNTPPSSYVLSLFFFSISFVHALHFIGSCETVENVTKSDGEVSVRYLFIFFRLACLLDFPVSFVKFVVSPGTVWPAFGWPSRHIVLPKAIVIIFILQLFSITLTSIIIVVSFLLPWAVVVTVVVLPLKT